MADGTVGHGQSLYIYNIIEYVYIIPYIYNIRISCNIFIQRAVKAENLF